jgi:hypothetical protein
MPAFKRKSVPRVGLSHAVVREVGQQKLLSTRICDLDLEPTEVLAECIAQVSGEIGRRGIAFRPNYYLGDDDFWTADRGISVNVPWYLSNSILWRLVNDPLFEYTRQEVLMYLRHETGHALSYGFKLWQRADWTQTFGDFRRPYKDVYYANPWTRDYVRYLHRTGLYHYAQKHPDEDWAETFAVWLDPASRWRRRYREWPVALAKLEYVDRVLEYERACHGAPPNSRPGLRVPYKDIKATVAEYFDIAHQVDPDLAEYRRDLLEVFPKRTAPGSVSSRRVPGRTTRHTQLAARFIQQHSLLLEERLSRWIGASNRRDIKRFLRQLEAVCTDEHLVVPDNRRNESLVDLTVIATWHVVDGVHRLSG